MSEWQNRIIRHENVAPDLLVANPLNARKHPQAQKVAMAGVLNEIGWIDDIIVSENSGLILDGHLRVEMALAKGEPTVPVKYVALTEAQERLALATFDYTTSLAELDDVALSELLEAVAQTPVEDEDVRALLAGLAEAHGVEPAKSDVDAEPQIDKADEMRQKWGVELGQLWQIAQHFVICGDCREPETWQRLLSAASVDKVNGVFTSPPYAEQRKEQYGGTPADKYVDWWEAVQANVKANLASDGSFFVNIKPHCEDGERVLYVMDLVLAMKRRWGWRFEEELIWKHGGTPKRVQRKFKNQFEPVYHFCQQYDFKFFPDGVRHSAKSVPVWDASRGLKGAKKASNEQGNGSDIFSGVDKEGFAYPGNVIESGFDTANQHVAAFPVALPDFFVRAHSDRGDAWCDPFCGSGTTILAAHNNQRIGLGIEYLPKYVAVILERLQEVTQTKPTRLEAA